MKITPALYEKIMEGLARAKASQEWAAQRGRYIPYPASWLNAGGWENEYRPMEESRPPKPKAPNDGLAKRLGR